MAKSSKKKASKPARQKQKPTKAQTVETSTEGVQLLLGNMMGAKDREYHVRTYLGLKKKVDKAKSDLSDFEKKAKESGVDMKAVKNVLTMEGWDPIDLADHLKWLSQTANDRGLPVQLALYEPKYGSPEKQAEALGYHAGHAGNDPLMDLYPENNPWHQNMMAGWRSGQAQLVEDGKPEA